MGSLLKKQKIAVVTTTRAEYGLLYWLIHDLHHDPDFELQLIVSGTHLSPEFGNTVQEIENDGFPVAARVDIIQSSDDPLGSAKSIGKGVYGFAEAFNDLKPDRIVVLGDRFEQLAVCSVAVALRIPIVHIHGGEITEGALDEQVRHAITKMAHIHFVTAEPYRKNLTQMGEEPYRIFNFGAPGIESIRRNPMMSKSEVEKIINFKIERPTVLVTYHPETLVNSTQSDVLNLFLQAIDKTGVRCIFTYANADFGGRFINKIFTEYADKRSDRCKIVSSLGQKLYLSLLQYVDVVLGNSSSGIIEVPSFKIPTINVGERQSGRIRSRSIIDCEMNTESIIEAINKSLSKDFLKNSCTGENIYGDGNFASRALKVLKSFDSTKELLKKKFHKI